jgi:hypothetical protein
MGEQLLSLCDGNPKLAPLRIVTAMLKGPSGSRFALKGGDAQSGSLNS